MIKFSNFLILGLSLILFSCDNDVTGNGDNCTADPVGEWSGVTRTIAYVEECGTHCADYGSAYQDYYVYCNELITIAPPGFEDIFCTAKQIVFYQNLDCYDYMDELSNPIEAAPDCFIDDGNGDDCKTAECKEECDEKGDVCTWGGAGVAHCVNGCEDENIYIDCEWNAANATCGFPTEPTQIDRGINQTACNQSNSTDPGSNCSWDGEQGNEDLDQDGELYEGNCVWGNELTSKINIESEEFTFDEDGNYYWMFNSQNETITGDYTCSDDNVEVCVDGDCEIWPFNQNGNNTVTIFRDDYTDEFIEYKTGCVATQKFTIEKITN